MQQINFVSPGSEGSESFPVMDPPFVQILHMGKNHWMTVVALDKTTVHVYDSMFRCPVYPCNQHHCCGPVKTTSFFAYLQIQEGGVDCGLFAIVFSIALETTQNVTGDHA